MGRHYSTRDFFRQTPNALLARYFEAQDALAAVDFTTLSEAHPDPLFEAWLELPEAERNQMDAEFREIHALSSEKGWCAIRDEAEWQLRAEPELYAEFMEKLSALDGHAERAMVAFLDYGRFWEGRSAVLPCRQPALLAQAQGLSAPARIGA